MENPIKMDDLGVPLFSETPTSTLCFLQFCCIYRIGLPISSQISTCHGPQVQNTAMRLIQFMPLGWKKLRTSLDLHKMVGHAHLAGANGSWVDCFGAGGVYPKNSLHTVDGRNPANQLRLVVYPKIWTRFYNSQVVGRTPDFWFASTVG